MVKRYELRFATPPLVADETNDGDTPTALQDRRTPRKCGSGGEGLRETPTKRDPGTGAGAASFEAATVSMLTIDV